MQAGKTYCEMFWQLEVSANIIITNMLVEYIQNINKTNELMYVQVARLNQTNLIADRVGVFYGQCSEICGINHAFMPIVVESVSLNKYCSHIDSLLHA